MATRIRLARSRRRTARAVASFGCAVGLLAALPVGLASPSAAAPAMPAAVSPVAPPVAPAAPAWRSGVFDGYGPSGDVRFGAWRGLPVRSATDYTPEDNWTDTSDPVWAIQQWAAAPSIQPVLSVPLWPASGGNFAAAAAGSYDAHFATLARNLVAGGVSDAVIRLAWEPDGTWYRWSVTDTRQAHLYAEAWRHIVTAMRSVPGEHFTFDWCLNLQDPGWRPAAAYPGDAYVSEIGEDVYDWSSALHQSAAARWAHLVDEPYGLAWQARFAQAHHKPVSFPEWGLVSDSLDPRVSGGDDPAFIQHMHDWFVTHRVVLEDYFDSDTSPGDVLHAITTGNGKFPRAAARYRRLFS